MKTGVPFITFIITMIIVFFPYLLRISIKLGLQLHMMVLFKNCAMYF